MTNLQIPLVGDRVKIVNAYDDSGEEHIGQTGKVTYACSPEYEVILDGLGGGYTFYYDGELEVITEEKEAIDN